MSTDPTNPDDPLVEKLLAQPSHCPYCGSDQLDAGPPRLRDYEDGYLCRVQCLDCRATWTEIYTVTAAANLKPGPAPAADEPDVEVAE